MNKNFSDTELNDLSRIIKNKLFKPQSEKKTTVFLCGADVKDLSKVRAKIASVFKLYPRFELLYPEDLFDDLLSGQGDHSLLELENILADSVDAIVIIPESPGSFAELGAFSNNQKLAEKIVCVSDKKFKREKSFINYGPIRLIKRSEYGQVIYEDYSNLDDKEAKHKLYRRVSSIISKIKKNNPVKRTITNILETENFILPCIYLMDEVDRLSLVKLVESATGENLRLCEIATKSSLSRLTASRKVTQTSQGFSVTQYGLDHVRDTYKRQYLDRARIELLNRKNRRNTRINYDRVTSALTFS